MQKAQVINAGQANERKVRPEDRVTISVFAMNIANGPTNLVDITKSGTVQSLARWNGNDFKQCHKTGQTKGGTWDGMRFDRDRSEMVSSSLPSRLFKSVHGKADKDRAGVQQQARTKGGEERNEFGQPIPKDSAGNTVRVHQPALAG
jgi:hypothetical protein